ncbi:helix-turn-helix transcriptional regulator [Speluncibacter jeojiensis]|uniref:Helix-turn-helix domain-containing protein n=1 Tax=Speluncibacter jeojiensis TaxID=2710754 RepID=A0A9X4LYD9_9ACTN|nr:helix-turn-helix domain-containing protein [Corynebacteriales bacterium D3-21]
MTLLLREAIGESLRRARTSQSRTLREVSSSARVSLGYLSEVERGRKEASSELLAAICTALEVPISEVLFDVSETMAESDAVRSGTDARVAQPVGAAHVDRPVEQPSARPEPAAAVHAAASLSGGPRVVIPQAHAAVLAA